MRRVLSLATLYPNLHRPRLGTFVARQMEALVARGEWDVTVINPIGVPPVAFGRYVPLAAAARNAREGGVEVLRPRFTLIPGIGGALNPGMIARAVLPLARQLHAARAFDLVDAQFFYPDGPAAARVAAALRLPLTIKARGADIQLWGGKAFARRRMLAAASQAEGLLAVSEALAGDMATLGMASNTITVHYTGLDRELFRPLDKTGARARLGDRFALALPPSAQLLATVGALIPRKGQIYVLRALTRLPDAHLALIGEGPDRAALKAFVRSAGIARRVHFFGSIDHQALPVLLAAADAMVLPSASEGLANAWVEALACGCPLVIADAGGAREVVTSPSAGRIVAREPDAIAAAVGELLSAPPPRDAVAACAARFSWEANAAALAAYYDGLVAT